MAGFSTSGINDLFPDAGGLPAEVQDAMLMAEGKVVEAAQKEEGLRMGVYRTGATLGSIKATSPRQGRDGVRGIVVAPHGKHSSGRRNGEVAFVNEYGTRHQRPRPFIRSANEESADAAVEAAGKIYTEYTEKNI